MIDYVMVKQQWQKRIQQCRSFPSADIASDHELVLCNVEMNFDRNRDHKPIPTNRKWDMEKLKDPS